MPGDLPVSLMLSILPVDILWLVAFVLTIAAMLVDRPSPSGLFMIYVAALALAVLIVPYVGEQHGG
jgi:hypothetical protein